MSLYNIDYDSGPLWVARNLADLARPIQRSYKHDQGPVPLYRWLPNR